MIVLKIRERDKQTPFIGSAPPPQKKHRSSCEFLLCSFSSLMYSGVMYIKVFANYVQLIAIISHLPSSLFFFLLLQFLFSFEHFLKLKKV